MKTLRMNDAARAIFESATTRCRKRIGEPGTQLRHRIIIASTNVSIYVHCRIKRHRHESIVREKLLFQSGSFRAHASLRFFHESTRTG